MKTSIVSPSEESFIAASKIIQENGIVGIPTETVYGLAGNAFNKDSLLNIFNTKERPTFDPLIIHIAPESLDNPLKELEDLNLIDPDPLSDKAKTQIEKLIQDFWPGPLTLVLPKNSSLPDLATSGLPTVGIRMPKHPIAQEFIRKCKTPLAAPSANRFGRISPTKASHVLEELGDLIPLIIDGGDCEIGLESTVLSIGKEGEMTLLRPGKISQEEIEETIGATIQQYSAIKEDSNPQTSPGLLTSHYAPLKKLLTLPTDITNLTPEFFNHQELPKTIGLLVFGSSEEAQKSFEDLSGKKVICYSFSESKDLKESAKNLFSQMRKLDSSEAEILFVEPCPSKEGIGFAIADRLKRAST